MAVNLATCILGRARYSVEGQATLTDRGYVQPLGNGAPDRSLIRFRRALCLDGMTSASPY